MLCECDAMYMLDKHPITSHGEQGTKKKYGALDPRSPRCQLLRESWRDSMSPSDMHFARVSRRVNRTLTAWRVSECWSTHLAA